MIENVTEIGPSDLLQEVSTLKYKGYRFVTASAADNRDGGFYLYYTFDKDLEMVNLRLYITKKLEIPSITDLYLAAFLVENELKELFGFNIKNILIDYEGRMFLTADAPFEPMNYGANISIEKRSRKL